MKLEVTRSVCVGSAFNSTFFGSAWFWVMIYWMVFLKLGTTWCPLFSEFQPLWSQTGLVICQRWHKKICSFYIRNSWLNSAFTECLVLIFHFNLQHFLKKRMIFFHNCRWIHLKYFENFSYKFNNEISRLNLIEFSTKKYKPFAFDMP